MTFENKKNTSDQKVSTKQQTYLGITKAGGDALGVMVNAALLTFYVDILHMDPELFGIVMLVFAIWNAINDPIFGYISDKKKMDGQGKRLHFIKLSAPIYLAGFLMFWLAFPSFSQASFFVFLLIGLLIFDTGLTIFGLNVSAISISQTTNTSERTKIAIIVSVVSFLPVGIAAILPNMILTSALALRTMRLIFLAMGGVSAILMFVGSYKMKELSLGNVNADPLPLWPALKETFKSKSFITFVIFNFMFTAVSSHLVAVMPLYFKYILQVGDWTVLYISAPIGVLQIGLYFLYGVIQRKFGLRTSAFIIIGAMILGFTGLFFFQNIVLVTISYALCIWMITFYAVIVNPLVGDVADEDELKTGRRREGMFFGINALITKPSSSLIIFLFTVILEHYGYDSELNVQTAEAQFGIKLGFSILAIAFIVLAIVPMILYPLHGNKIQKVKDELKIKHDEIAGLKLMEKNSIAEDQNNVID